MQKAPRHLSRRAFLAAAGSLTAAGLAARTNLGRIAAAPAIQSPASGSLPDDPEWEFVQPRPAELNLWGRITDPGSPVYDTPFDGNGVIGYLHQHEVLPVLETAQGEMKNLNNPLWYRFAAGWVYTTNVQRLRPYTMPEEIREIDTIILDPTGEPKPGFWGEIIVPFTTARSGPSSLPAELIDGSPMVLFYSSVHRVIAAEADDAGFLWYKVADDRKNADPYYVLGRHMREIKPHELDPINPGADKRMEVTISGQRIDCYEGDMLVYSTLMSSGGEGFDTPKGEHAVVYKQPSRHMYSDPENEAFSDPNYFDLPGVPFNQFITTLGHAIHGTFWHGDFGRRRSHGCLNVTPEAARWLFRWAEPVASYEQSAAGSSADPGTPVTVVD